MPDGPHCVKVEGQVVDGVQNPRQCFSRGIEMSQISARIAGADPAAAARIERPRIGGGMISHDPEMAAAYDADPLIHGWASPRFYTEFLRTAALLPKLLPRITCPTLVLQAGDDHVVSFETTQRLFPLIGSADKQLIVYDGFYHEVLNELERKRVRADLLQWLRRH